MAKSIFSNNLSLYSHTAVARQYAQRHELFPSEQAIIERVAARCSGKPILDVGVGGGRTTSYLLEISKDYVGIDYSPKMVELCRRCYPGIRFEHADARRLDAYPSSHFAFVMFSFNGLDYVSHEDRLLVLDELWRVLANDGILAFSSHNRLWTGGPYFDLKSLATMNPLKFGLRLVNCVPKLKNYLKLRHHAREETEYSIRVGRAFNYSLLVYHVRADDQARQLKDAGFNLMAVFNMYGEEISVHSDDTGPWLHYLAKKMKPALK